MDQGEEGEANHNPAAGSRYLAERKVALHGY